NAADQVDRRHDHARRAEAALQPVILAEGFLHRMELAVLCKALDRGDLGTRRLDGEHRAGLHRAPVHVDDARAALAGVAADMRAGESELVAQEIDEQRAVLGIDRYRLPVHLHGNGCHGSTLMDGDAESFGIPLPAVKGGSSPPHQRSTAPKITSRITTTPTRPTTQISGANPSLRMVGTGAG